MIGRFKKEVTQSKLVITGSDPVPHDIKAGLYTRRADLTVTHEEADVIIANHVVHIARETRGTIHVVCDDTDVFVLLVHFYSSESLQGNIFTVPTRTSRSSVDIGATAKKHHDIARYILPLHALTGCDTVSTLYGIGKIKAWKVLKQGHLPPLLGDSDTSMEALEATAVRFIARCYGSKSQGTMSEVRFCVWQHKTSRGKSHRFKLASLPPTSSAFQLHVRRAHYQACLWKASLQSSPPNVDSTDFGWMADHANQILLPVTLPTGTLAAPEKVLNLLCCSCSSADACASRRCTCRKSDIACSVFCKCNMNFNIHCLNPFNKTVQDNLDGDDDDTDDDNDDE